MWVPSITLAFICEVALTTLTQLFVTGHPALYFTLWNSYLTLFIESTPDNTASHHATSEQSTYLYRKTAMIKHQVSPEINDF